MSVFTLKLIGLILMVIDHIGYFFPYLKGMIFMRILGRLVAPIYFYMLVEGFIYTSDKDKYKNRLLLFGTIMLFGNLIISFCLNLFNINILYNISPLSPNIFLNMFYCILTLIEIEKIKEKVSIINISKLIFYIYLINFMEYSLYSITMVLIFYLFREKKVIKWVLYVISCIILCYINKNIIQMFMIFAMFLLLFYNGNKGYSNKMIKYFFYLFYIIHIWILIFISFM